MTIPCRKGTTTGGEKVGQSMQIRTSTLVNLTKTKYSPTVRPVNCKRRAKRTLSAVEVPEAGRCLGFLQGESGGCPLLMTGTLCQPVNGGGGGGMKTKPGRSGPGMFRVSQKKRMSSGTRRATVFPSCVAVRLKGEAPAINDGITL